MIWRRVIGTLAGAGLCIATISVVELAGHKLLGVPADPSQATLPMLLSVLAAWTLGAVIGGYLGTAIARWSGAAWIVAALVVVGVIATALTLGQPWWMTAGGIAAPLAAAALVSRRKSSGDQRVAL